MVGLDTGLVSNPAAAFGGVKQSGLGRGGGRVGIEAFLEHPYLAKPGRDRLPPYLSAPAGGPRPCPA